MGFNIIMFVCMYPIIFILYFVLRLQCRYGDGYLFSVQMKSDWVKAAEIEQAIAGFQKEMKIYFIIFLLVPLTSFLPYSISIQYTIWMMWLLAILFFFSLPFVRTNRKLRNWKKEHHSFIENEDEDKLWIGGIIYYNPKDRHTMVTKRAGVGTTTNMATPVGKGLLVITIIAFLSMPVSCVWMMLDEFMPIELSIQNDMLIAEHLKADYEIPVEDIADVKLLAELPRWSKSTGTGMDNLEIGTFYIRNVGKCEVFLNPQNEKFIYFTFDGKDYYMSGIDDEETERIYEELTR